MKHSALVLPARPALILFSPGKSAIPQRLRITLWQTPSWMKQIIKLRKPLDAGEGTQTMRQRSK